VRIAIIIHILQLNFNEPPVLNRLLANLYAAFLIALLLITMKFLTCHQ